MLCKHCQKELIGRSDKKYCNEYCKSGYYYEKSKSGNSSFYRLVDRQLKLNRRLLKQYNKSGKSIVRSKILEDEGFNPSFFTHYWKNKRGDVYLFVYEYGFLKTKERDINKYVLVKYQDYMKM